MRLVSRDVAWSAAEAGGSALFSVVSAFLVARLIGPYELGVGAAAVAVHVLLWVAVNSLFADAVVQRHRLDETTLSCAVWASTAVGCAAAMVQAGSGWPLAWMLHDARLIPMCLLLALPLPFVGLGGALQGKLTRERRYRALALRTLTGQVIGVSAGLLLAVHRAGAWAPVAQQAAISMVAAWMLIATAGWRPRAILHWAEVRSLLRVGLPLTASTMVQIGRYRIFALLIGGSAGSIALGQIHMAFRLVDTVRDITFTALWRLLLPILSEHQHDRSAMLAEVDRLGRLSSLVTMPICGALTIALVPLTTLLLGPEWRAAGVAAVPLAGLMALMALSFPSGVALIAVGQARYTLFANLAGLALIVAFVLVFRPGAPWPAVLLWGAAQLLVYPYSLWVNARALGVGPARPPRACVPALLAAGAGVLAALAIPAGAPLRMLLWRGAVFATVLAVSAMPLLWRRRQPMAA
jgi:polysaccharide transporter, PST family